MPIYNYEFAGLMISFQTAIIDSIKKTRTREKTRGETREKIIALIEKDPNISTLELSKKMNLTIKGIEWQIKKLKE